MKKFRNTIIVPYCLFEQFSNKGYNKIIYADRHCENDRWYYYSKIGQLRTVIDNKIYIAIIDADGWPSRFLRRIR